MGRWRQVEGACRQGMTGWGKAQGEKNSHESGGLELHPPLLFRCSRSAVTDSPVLPGIPIDPRFSPQSHLPLAHPHPVLDGFGSALPVQNSQRSLPPGGKGAREGRVARAAEGKGGKPGEVPGQLRAPTQIFTPAPAPSLLSRTARPHSPRPGRGSVHCDSSHPCWLLDRGGS